MSVTVRVVGMESLQRKLGTNFTPAMRGATKAIAAQIHGVIAPYADETISNSPSQRRWYERGYGPRWRRADGSIGGRKTSETLGRRSSITGGPGWSIRKLGSIGASLGNIASYAPFVHDAKKQAGFHGARGWVTDEAAVNRVLKSGTVEKIMRDAVRKAMR